MSDLMNYVPHIGCSLQNIKEVDVLCFRIRDKKSGPLDNNGSEMSTITDEHDDVIKWKRFPRYWPFVWGIKRSPLNSPHKGQ